MARGRAELQAISRCGTAVGRTTAIIAAASLSLLERRRTVCTIHAIKIGGSNAGWRQLQQRACDLRSACLPPLSWLICRARGAARAIVFGPQTKEFLRLRQQGDTRGRVPTTTEAKSVDGEFLLALGGWGAVHNTLAEVQSSAVGLCLLSYFFRKLIMARTEGVCASAGGVCAGVGSERASGTGAASTAGAASSAGAASAAGAVST